MPSPVASDSQIELPDSVRTTTHLPVQCDACKEFPLDGDDSFREVQCEECTRVIWSHMDCLDPTGQRDWNNENIKFTCRECRRRDEPDGRKFFPGEVIMLPHTADANWAALNTVWYPAQFIQHHESRKLQPNEYEFRWLECTDGAVYQSSSSVLPVSVLRTAYFGRKFLEQIQLVELSEQQIGNIHLPFYMKPDDPAHNEPALTAIFEAALPSIADILADWNLRHPVIRSFEEYFRGKKTKRGHEACSWMQVVALDPTPALEAVMTNPLALLMRQVRLGSLGDEERSVRVLGVGLVLFQLLAAQHELGEPLDLNGDLFKDLEQGSVVACRPDGDSALNTMFSALPITGRNVEEYSKAMLVFKKNHTIFDKNLRPAIFRRQRPSSFAPSEPMPVTMHERSKRKRKAVGDAKTVTRATRVEQKDKRRKAAGKMSG